MALALAIVWAPIASHCAWEGMPGLQLFQCATDVPQDSDCAQDACARIETASYKSSDSETIVPSPVRLTIVLETVLARDLPAPLPPPGIGESKRIPGWRFAHRVALPPRAPSFAS